MKKILSSWLIVCLLSLMFVPVVQAEDVKSATVDSVKEVVVDKEVDTSEKDLEAKPIDESLKETEDPTPEENKEVLEDLEADLDLEGEELYTKSLGSDVYEPFLDYAVDPTGAQKSLGIYETDFSTGAATYNYSLSLPGGRNGVQPQIAVSYNNQAASADSLAGYGWDVSVGGSISRTQDYGVEDIYTTNEFYLSMPGASGKLIALSLIDSEHGEYGLQVEESFYKYEFLADDSWLITDKSGTQYYFGQTSDSRQDDPNDSTRIFEWELDVIQDTSDNYVRYEYFKDQGQIYPKAVYYTGNGNPEVANDGPVEVRFQPFYDGVQAGDERDDWTKWYDKGFEVKTEYLVNDVEVIIDGYLSGQPVREYNLNYTTGENGRRSMLESVVETGTSIEGDVVQLPATEFTYSMSDGFYDFDYEGVYADLSEGSNFVDVNGDGYADQTPFDDVETDPPYYSYFYTKLSSQGIGYGGEYFRGYFDTYAPSEYGHFVDMNGDALPEYIGLFDSPYPGSGSYNCNFRNFGNGLLSGSFGLCGANPQNVINREVDGYRFGDMNGDGLSDLFSGDLISSDWTQPGDSIYLNTGDGTFSDSGFDSPVSFSWGSDQYPQNYTGQDTGARLVDLNGDGLVDIVHSYVDDNYDFYTNDSDPPVLNVYINTGDGSFVQSLDYDLEFANDVYSAHMEYGDYSHPDETYYSYSKEVCYLDFNGDGVMDMLKGDSPYIWDGVDTWVYASYDYSIVDLSCGGYVYGASNSWSYGSGDLNGDGIVDFYQSLEQINNGVRGTYFSIEGKPDLLTDVSTSIGSDISISYKSALQYLDDSDQLLNPDLPFALYTVEEVIIDDGLGNQSATTYEYRGGQYFKYFDGVKGEFSRFEEVSAFEDGSETIYYFDVACYEGDLCFAKGLEDEMIVQVYGYYGWYVVDGDMFRHVSVDPYAAGICSDASCTQSFDTYESDVLDLLQEGDPWDDYGDDFMYDIDWGQHALKGKLKMVEVYDDLGNLYSKTVNDWSVTDLGDGRYYPHVDEVVEFAFDGEVDARETAVSYTYNSSYGLLMTETQWGEVEADESTYEVIDEMLGDEVYVSYSYASDTGLWVFKEAEILWEDGAGTDIKGARYYYDNYATLGDIDAGLATEEWVWWDDAGEWVPNFYDYDSYGNLTSSINPKGYETTIAYDSNHFYPQTITNPLSQSVSMVMNYINGQPAEYTDYNGYTYYYVYDGLGRPLTVEGPSVDGSSTVQHAEYVYDDLSMPRSMCESAEDGTVDGFNTYTYLDGLDRQIQVRVEGEIDYSVVDTVYNTRGEVDLSNLAYFSAGSSYTSADLTQPTTEYSYDALLRITDVTTPLGTTTTDYSHWAQTVTDAMNNVKDFYYDAYGNLVRVDEIGLYSTYYDYDLLGNLIYIEDAMGNVRAFDYNSLGLITMQEEMHDPADVDYATWEYYYDYNGNLHMIVLPGDRVTYSYDHLDRVLIERTDLVPIISIYTYDTAPNGIGLLASVEDRAGEISYEYDTLGRVASEHRVVGRDSWTTEYSSDLMGRLETVTYPSESVASYTFNEGGFVESVTYDGETVLSDLDYSPMGQWEEVYYGNGDTTINTYDPQEMYFLDTKVTTSATGTVLQDLSYTYDSVGDVLTIIDESDLETAKEITYGYDDLYRLTSATAQSSTGLIFYDRTYDYNEIGNMTYKSDIGTLYYDETGNANPYAVTSAGAYVFDYDVRGNVTADGVFDYEYSFNNNMLSSDDGNGNYLEYLYDYSGNRVVKDDTAYTISYYPNQYHEENRSPSDDPTFKDYVFVDGVRVMVNEGPIEPDVEYPDLQVTQVCLDGSRLTVESQNTGTVDVTDYTGRTFIYLDGSLRWTYTWQWLADKNFLLAGGYSWLQPRVLTAPYPEVEACVDATNRIVESNEDNNCMLVTDLQPCVTAPAPPQGEEVAAAAESFYYHQDHLGGSSVMTDDDGSVVQVLAYYPYGGEYTNATYADFETDYQFTDQELDAETGLYYYGARYYNTDLATFVSQDPAVYDERLGDIIYDPQLLNAYAYTRNNPVIYTDPSGEWLDTVIDVGSFGYNFTGWASNTGKGILAGLSGDFDAADQYYDAAVGNSVNALTDVGFAAVPGMTAGVKYVDDVAEGAAKIGDDIVEATVKQADSVKFVDDLDGAYMSTDDALDLANDFLGSGQKTLDSGVYRSADDIRQVRMTDSDLFGNHGGGSHINFETFGRSDKNIHIYLNDF